MAATTMEKGSEATSKVSTPKLSNSSESRQQVAGVARPQMIGDTEHNLDLSDIPLDIEPIPSLRSGTKSSKWRGVTRAKRTGPIKWQAQIMSGGYNFYLGLFDSEKEAAVEYARAYRKLFGKKTKRSAGKRKRPGSISSTEGGGKEGKDKELSATSSFKSESVLRPGIVQGENIALQTTQYREQKNGDCLPKSQSDLKSNSASSVAPLPRQSNGVPKMLVSTDALKKDNVGEIESQLTLLPEEACKVDGQKPDNWVCTTSSTSFAMLPLPRIDDSIPTIVGESGLVKIVEDPRGEVPPPVQHPLPRVAGLQIPPPPPNSAISAGTGPPPQLLEDAMDAMPSRRPLLKPALHTSELSFDSKEGEALAKIHACSAVSSGEWFEDDPLPNTACAANAATLSNVFQELPTSTLNNYASIEKQAAEPIWKKP